MATAQEFAAAVWAEGIVDPYDDKVKPAGLMLGYARIDVFKAWSENAAKLDALSAQVAALALGSGDAEAIQAAIREIVREELNNTRLGTAG